MSTVDIEKLKALAEAATPSKWSVSGSYIAPTREESGTTYVESWRSIALVSCDADRAFISAASPAAVLEMVTEIERLKIRNSDQAKQIQWLGDYNTKRHVELSFENVQVIRDRLNAEKERDQLKAENEDGLAVIRTQKQQLECYIKDAERYRWLRDGASVILSKEVGFIAESGVKIYSTMPSQRELDAAVDAAMAKEQQP